MKQLDKVVNVIPVISKADTLTLEEREAFKKRVSMGRVILLLFIHYLPPTTILQALWLKYDGFNEQSYVWIRLISCSNCSNLRFMPLMH